jgi:deazaflavin-dependent oxidoreductase (nitroreductase family)
MSNERRRPPQATRVFNKGAAKLAGTRAVPLWGLVIHRGRRSGKTYRTPVAVLDAESVFYIALPWGRRTDWVLNLRAAGGGTLRWKGKTYAVTDPTYVDKDEVLTAITGVRRRMLERWPLEDALRLRHGPPA